MDLKRVLDYSFIGAFNMEELECFFLICGAGSSLFNLLSRSQFVFVTGAGAVTNLNPPFGCKPPRGHDEPKF